uniref:Uncharacterized protein n=1 Tax=Phaeomonas parva TaxID=124430 RepID=A0A7S1XUF1_9STRA|mmetsp:Transcript_40386/g.126401  ORF Transcript_40386/g.126401 Transcript_40386/m.126401 type:complete len:433 (+) Transcript_40386:91-1389(+)
MEEQKTREQQQQRGVGGRPALAPLDIDMEKRRAVSTGMEKTQPGAISTSPPSSPLSAQQLRKLSPRSRSGRKIGPHAGGSEVFVGVKPNPPASLWLRSGVRPFVSVLLALLLVALGSAVLSLGAMQAALLYASGLAALVAAALVAAHAGFHLLLQPREESNAAEENHSMLWFCWQVGLAACGVGLFVGDVLIGVNSLTSWDEGHLPQGRVNFAAAVAFIGAAASLGVGLDALLAVAQESLKRHLEPTTDGHPALRWVRLLCCGRGMLKALCLAPFVAVCIFSFVEAGLVWDEDCGDAVYIHEFVLGAALILGVMTVAFALVLFMPNTMRASVRMMRWICAATLLCSFAALAWACAGIAWLAADEDGQCPRDHPHLWAAALIDKILLLCVAAPTITFTICCRTERCFLREDDESAFIDISRESMEKSKRFSSV